MTAGLFENKVVIVTGAGRGIGRAEALLFAAEGARVVVNDLGVSDAGAGSDASPADQLVAEIVAGGGDAVADHGDCSDWADAERLIDTAYERWGRLDVLVANAGIVRDRMSFNMSEDEFDAVIKVHLKGHFAPVHHATTRWRALSKSSGAPVDAAVVLTSSEAGLYGNAGQVNYVAAKAGIASMTIALARELERTGVRVNAISPVAATRLLGGVDAAKDIGDDPRYDPANAAAGAAWLASEHAAGITGQILKIQGGFAQLFQGWRPVTEITGDGIWTIDALAEQRDTLFAGIDPGVPPFLGGKRLGHPTPGEVDG